jgi:hypothetical protein
MVIRAMVRIFSFGERWNVPFNSAVASLNGTFHLSPNENIPTIALINIHYLYIIHRGCTFHLSYPYWTITSLYENTMSLITVTVHKLT